MRRGEWNMEWEGRKYPPFLEHDGTHSFNSLSDKTNVRFTDLVNWDYFVAGCLSEGGVTTFYKIKFVTYVPRQFHAQFHVSRGDCIVKFKLCICLHSVALLLLLKSTGKWINSSLWGQTVVLAYFRQRNDTEGVILFSSFNSGFSWQTFHKFCVENLLAS